MTTVQQVELPERAITPRRLGILTVLFNRLHGEGIRYCHWKSNEHLGASMTGATDVDVLFDRKAVLPLAQILSELGFKRFTVKPGRGYPGIEDYLGFDAATGKLTHLHVHYQLTLGEKFLKGHRLPWEELVLSTRVLDSEHEIYVTDPHVELTLLLVRAAMKIRTRDWLLAGVRQPYFRGPALRELRWLIARVDTQRLHRVARQLVGERAASVLLDMITGERPTIRHLRALRRSAQPSLSEYRLYGAADALRLGWLREWSALRSLTRSRLLHVPGTSTRTAPQGGVLIAFVGADGSGKSTLTREITAWLSREAAVLPIYGGSGQGPVSVPRRALQLAASLVRRGTRGRASRTPAAPSSGGEGAHVGLRAREPTGLRAVGRLLWVLALARERRRQALRARRARSLGLIVIADRLPQSQFVGLNDGPRLSTWLGHRSRLFRGAAERELATFGAVELCPPDLVVKLHVSPDVALQRKPETPVDQVHRKVDVVRQLQYPPTTRVVDVDANQPLEQVLLQVKQAVWDSI